MTSLGRGAVLAERRLRKRIRGDLLQWCRFALAGQGLAPARHHRLVIEELEGLAAGKFDRLMLLLPPGSAKSTYASLLFVPWFLARFSGSHVIAASHTASLAWGFGRGVRGLIAAHRARLGLVMDPASRAAGRFGLVGGGSYFATGVRGPITGRRADLVIVDDPVKSQREADSSAQREHLWDWFRSELVTRLPALAEDGDALGRAPGEALWPEWEDVAALERKRLALGERVFGALFQQAPRAPEGRLFQVKRIAVVGEALAGVSVRAWDLAASEGGGDWTVGVRLCRSGDGVFQVVDVVRLQGGPEAVVRAIRDTAVGDGREVSISLPQDPGQAGRAQVSFLTRELAGFRVSSSPESGAKAVRAMGVASQANAGNLSVLRGGWNRVFLEEVADFPGGAKDDQVDALSRGFSALVDAPGPARAVRARWAER